MKLGKLAIALLALALTACVPVIEAYQAPRYSVGEIQLLTTDASERWAYFYGDPQTVVLDGETLELQPAPEQQNVWAVPGALWVSGQPVFREVLPALTMPAETVAGFPFSDYYVTTSAELESAWLYDGAWYRLSGRLPAGARVKAEPERENPTFDGLTSNETAVILREILARNPTRPLVVYQLSTPVYPMFKLQPAPFSYRQAALAVQYGIREELILDFSQPPANPGSSWKLLARGSMSAYREPTPYAVLATSQTAFLQQIWPLASGNRVPRPAPPQVDFERQSVAAFFWGQKRSGGYSLEVLGVELNGDVAEIRLELKRPAPGTIVTQSLTSPYVLVELEGKPRLARFYDQNGNLLAEAPAQ
ncbi:protease complex subunit PrcB family protein [Oceanithermus sp.]